MGLNGGLKSIVRLNQGGCPYQLFERLEKSDSCHVHIHKKLTTECHLAEVEMRQEVIWTA
jgi:hypothetical protein